MNAGKNIDQNASVIRVTGTSTGSPATISTSIITITGWPVYHFNPTQDYVHFKEVACLITSTKANLNSY